MVMAAVPDKQKQAVLTLGTSWRLCALLRREVLKELLVRNLEFAKSTIADIWKDCKQISDSVSASESLAFTKKRCTIHHAKYDLVDEACWKLFCQQRSKGAPVSGVLLQEKCAHSS